jgi:hypothetical protein
MYLPRYGIHPKYERAVQRQVHYCGFEGSSDGHMAHASANLTRRKGVLNALLVSLSPASYSSVIDVSAWPLHVGVGRVCAQYLALDRRCH